MKIQKTSLVKQCGVVLSFLWILCLAPLQGHSQNMAFKPLFCTTSYTIEYFLPMPSGSIFVSGYDTVDNANKKSTALLKKYDQNFNLIWEKRFGGSGYESFNFIMYLGDNRLLVRGITNSQDGDVQNNYPFGQNEWVCVLDTNGNILHQLIYGASGDGTQSHRIKMGPNGDLYFCGGTYSDTFDFIDKGPFDFNDDGYIACADSQLNKKWLKFQEVNNGDSHCMDVNFLPNGHLILAFSTNVADGDLAVQSPTPRGATVLLEMDTLGTVFWQKRYGANDPASWYGDVDQIFKDPNKWAYYLVGYTSSKTADCWDTYPYLTSNDPSYHWIMKVDTLGTKIWSHIYGAFSASGNTQLGSNTALLDSNMLHFPDLAEGSDNYVFGTAIGPKDTWLVDVDSNGILTKHYRVGYPGAEWSPNMVQKNPATNERYYLYRFGNFLTTSRNIPNVCDTSALATNYIIGKYDYWPLNFPEPKGESQAILIYPNPTSDELIISGLEKGMLIQVFNSSGQLVKSSNATSSKEKFSVKGWIKGTYIFKFRDKNIKETHTVLIQ